MHRRSRRWIWVGWSVFMAIAIALMIYFVVVGLDKADKVASSVSAVLALLALAAPYLLPPPSVGGGSSIAESDRAEETGKATAAGGGDANTGVQTNGGTTSALASHTGDAEAQGPSSTANTGVQRRTNRRP